MTTPSRGIFGPGDEAVRTAGPDWVGDLRRATARFDWTVASDLTSAFAAHIQSAAVVPETVTLVLQVLRRARLLGELETVADAALTVRPDDVAVRRRYAQALVDGGRPSLALRLYCDLARSEALWTSELVEVRGGIGRCYKELFLACAEPERRQEFLARSLEAYLASYSIAGGSWAGINAVALIARAAREGIHLAAHLPSVDELARRVLGTVDGADDSDPWADATACEALIALGRSDDAVGRALAVIARKPDSFMLAAFLRQLHEVWELGVDEPPGDELLPLLRSVLLQTDGGELRLFSAAIGAAPLDGLDGRFEAVHGTDRYKPLSWYREGLLRCRAVASLRSPTGAGVGTGFMVAGSDLHPHLPPVVVLTNGHVVPESLRTATMSVAFHGLDDDPGPVHRFRVVRQCWYQPSAHGGLDTSILELDGHPRNVLPIPLAAGLPQRPLERRRAYVIGHPLGTTQPQFSLQDNLLLDYDDRVLHYRSPTEPGSSGSPVFDDEWELIGLHHFGGARVPHLNSRGGTYAANEGIAVHAIRRALAVHPPEGRDENRSKDEGSSRRGWRRYRRGS